MQGKRSFRLLLLTLCLCMLVGTACARAEAAAPERHTLVLTYSPLSEGIAAFSAEYASASPLELIYGEYIKSISLSYQQGDNWVAVTQDNADDLPAGPQCQYQFEFAYESIPVEQLLAAGGQMVFRDLPGWFKPEGIGAIMDGSETAARIECANGEIVITFNQEWLERHKGTDLSGTFKVYGYVDWHELPGDGGPVNLPGLDKDLHFEKDLAQRYGALELVKSEPKLLRSGDGKYYLKYELTVSSKEPVDMPDVTVRDLFAMPEYIESYFGVDSAAPLPDRASEDMRPWESRQTGVQAGALSLDGGGMLWTIGTLMPNETRTLTYYAQIAQTYVDEVTGNLIVNQAEAFSGGYPKARDDSFFSAQNSLRLTKESTDAIIDPDGNGTISYKITIEVGEENSFVLQGLKVHDAFTDERLGAYLSGDGGEVQLEITTVSADGRSNTQTRAVPYQNASFDLDGLTFEPGDTVTITYTVQASHLFLLDNGEVTLTNQASLMAGGTPFSSSTNQKSFEPHNWMKKIAGNPIPASRTIDIPQSDEVYGYSGERIAKEPNPGSFNVPAGSIEYRIYLNDDGIWNLSSAIMSDKFSSEYLEYAGYVRIELYEVEGETKVQPPAKTVWLNADGLGSFSFTPSQLGIAQDEPYAYELTYYAKLRNAENVGMIQVSNDFELSGDIGYGDGTITIPGTKVSQSTVIEGGAHYEAEKIGWYYTPYPVHKTTGDQYSEANFEADYQNGAVYWAIRLEGDIGVGKATGSGNTTELSGFYVSDAPDSQTIFKRDSVVGIFDAPKGFDITGFDSFPDLLKYAEENEDQLIPLRGNPQNDKWPGFASTKVSDPQYEWYASDSNLDGIIFPKGYDLQEDRVLLIVLRTVPKSIANTQVFTNALSITSGDTTVPIDSASIPFIVKDSLFKESKGAYIYDKDSDPAFTNCSDRQGGNWHIETLVDRDALTSPGIYAAWLLNVNWNGTMQGTYDIVDYLPAGMELVYADVNNFGVSIKRSYPNNCPQTEIIQELANDPAWRSITKTSKDDIGNDVTTITYYNPATGEIRWRISGFTSRANLREGLKQREINLRIICRVRDPELFLNQVKTYVNEAVLLRPGTEDVAETEYADVTIKLPLDKNLDLDNLYGTVTDQSVKLRVNRLPFRLEINPWGDDICGGNALPALIDELSPGLSLIEGTLKITTAGGAEYTNYTYSVETRKDGGQSLIIHGLPDATPLTITYEAKLEVGPNEPISFSNSAYWAGYDPPDKPQVSYPEASYEPSGDVFAGNTISVTIIKMDAHSHSKRLDGAQFEVCEYADGGWQTAATGISDSYGKIVFASPDYSLKTNTLYSIEETQAPAGYERSEEKHYFIVYNPSGTLQLDMDDLKRQYGDALEIWYGGPDYTFSMENDNGTILAEKVFLDAKGREYTPDSGTYRFGLFDGQTLVEILTVEYIGDGERICSVNGIQKDLPEFSKHDRERIYRVCELDEDDQPIEDNALLFKDGVYYRVAYSADEVLSGGMIEITNAVQPQALSQALTLFKLVHGSGAQTDRSFTFEVTLENIDDTFPVESNQIPELTSVTFVDGKARLTLKGGEYAIIKNLPAGIAYAVEEWEANQDGYVTTATGQSGVITPEGADAIFINAKDDAQIPQTADGGHAALWTALVLLSLCGLTAMAIKGRRLPRA